MWEILSLGEEPYRIELDDLKKGIRLKRDDTQPVTTTTEKMLASN